MLTTNWFWQTESIWYPMNWPCFASRQPIERKEQPKQSAKFKFKVSLIWFFNVKPFNGNSQNIFKTMKSEKDGGYWNGYWSYSGYFSAYFFLYVTLCVWKVTILILWSQWNLYKKNASQNNHIANVDPFPPPSKSCRSCHISKLSQLNAMIVLWVSDLNVGYGLFVYFKTIHSKFGSSIVLNCNFFVFFSFSFNLLRGFRMLFRISRIRIFLFFLKKLKKSKKKKQTNILLWLLSLPLRV